MRKWSKIVDLWVPFKVSKAKRKQVLSWPYFSSWTKKNSKICSMQKKIVVKNDDYDDDN